MIFSAALSLAARTFGVVLDRGVPSGPAPSPVTSVRSAAAPCGSRSSDQVFAWSSRRDAAWSGMGGSCGLVRDQSDRVILAAGPSRDHGTGVLSCPAAPGQSAGDKGTSQQAELPYAGIVLVLTPPEPEISAGDWSGSSAMGGPPRRPGPPQPMSRRRRWPVSALVAALVAAVAVGCVVAAAWLVWATPGDGVMMQSRGGMPWSTGRSVAVTGTLASAPLRPGDEVLAVDGRDIHEWAGYLVSHPAGIRPWRPGQTVVYRVVRDGAVRQIGVLVRQPVQSAGNWPWSEIAIRVLALLVTGFVFLRRPETPAARAGLLFAAGYALNLSFPAFTLQVHPLLGPIGAIPYLM